MRRTSRDSYYKNEASGLLSKRRWQAYDILYNYGPMTATELTQRGVPGGWKRLSELRDYGVAEEVGEKTCTVTGENVILWDINDKLAKKPPKTPKSIKTLESEIARLQRELTRVKSKQTPQMLLALE